MIVPPVGPTNAPLLAIVGEAPGGDEERLGQPFVGASGQLLNQMLAHAGIDRAVCYITNLSKVRPPNNDFKSRYYVGKSPTPELLTLRRLLVEELQRVRPSVVVALGGEPLGALTPLSGITTHRGILTESNDLRIVPSLHPAFLLRGQMEQRAVVEADLKKALRQARQPSKPITRFVTDPTFSQVLDLLHTRPKRLALDLETTMNLTRIIGLAWSESDAMAIPIMHGHRHRWSEIEERMIITAFAELMEDETVEKVLQNGMYDCTILAREYGIQVNGIVLDTMLAHHTLYPELLKGLDFQSSIYTDFPMYWGEGTNAEYCCYDCCVTFIAAREEEAELKRRGMWDYFQQYKMRAARAFMYIQSRGVLIDQKARSEVRAETVIKRDQCLVDIKAAVGHEVNPLSPKQVSALVYDEWKLDKQYKGFKAARRVTADEDALQTLCRKYPQREPVLQNILSYRQHNVLISTFCDQELLDGRSVTSYNVAGTVTDRLASGTTIDGLGGNLQNLPRGSFRRIVVPDSGRVLVKADLSQAEYRVLVWKTRLLRVIERWIDNPTWSIHRWNACENIYRIPYTALDPDRYSKAKNGTFGANYGIGPLKVSRMYNIPLPEARMILERYHGAVPEIQFVFQKEIRDEVIATKCLCNPLGRQRSFLGQLDDDLYRAAYSDYCQSTVGGIINTAACDLVEDSVEMPELGLEVLLQVHDELVFQCFVGKVEETVDLIRRRMERPITFPGVSVPLVIPCEIKVGMNWFDTMDVKKWKTQSLVPCALSQLQNK